MNVLLRIALVVGIILYFIVIFELLKKDLLNMKYTLLWMGSGGLMLFIVIFPYGLEKLIHMLGIVELTNGLFSVVLFCILLLLMAITSIVSMQNKKIRRLVQVCALYEKRIRQLEELVKKEEKYGEN